MYYIIHGTVFLMKHYCTAGGLWAFVMMHIAYRRNTFESYDIFVLLAIVDIE